MRELFFLISVISVISLLSFGYSKVFIESPVQTNLLLKQATHIGSVMPGQSFQFVMSSYCGLECNEEWDTATIEPKTLPKGWTIDGGDWNLPSFQVRVKVPENAKTGKYILKVKMQDQGETIPSEYGLISVNVSNTLLSLQAKSNQSTIALENGNIIFKVKNTSLSEINVIVSSSLLSKWWGKQKITIFSGTNKEFLFPIRITESGTYKTNLILSSENTNKIQATKQINITATPTIQSKLTAPSHGFPLYPVSLQPIFSLMGAFSFLFE